MIEGYFVLNHLLSESKLIDMKEILKEFNNTVIAESYYSTIMNAEMNTIF